MPRRDGVSSAAPCRPPLPSPSSRSSRRCTWRRSSSSPTVVPARGTACSSSPRSRSASSSGSCPPRRGSSPDPWRRSPGSSPARGCCPGAAEAQPPRRRATRPRGRARPKEAGGRRGLRPGEGPLRRRRDPGDPDVPDGEAGGLRVPGRAVPDGPRRRGGEGRGPVLLDQLLARRRAGYLEISVRRQGRASAALHETVRAGGVLPIRGPGGSFVYPDEPDVPLVLHAGGVGVTPMISMLRHAASVGAGAARDVPLHGEGRAGRRFPRRARPPRAPRARASASTSRSAGASRRPGFLTGRMDARSDRAVRARPRARRSTSICGPAAMIASLREGLASLGVPADRIRFEAFEAAVRRPRAGSRRRGETGPRSPGAADDGPGRGRASSTRPRRRASPSTRCAGRDSCGTCRTRLLSGRVEGERQRPVARGSRGGLGPAVRLRSQERLHLDA